MMPPTEESLVTVRQIFLDEAQEILERIIGRLLDWDDGAEEVSEAVTEVLGDLHTLKGAASAAQFPELKLLAHALEEVCGRSPGIEERRFLFDGADYITSFLQANFGDAPAPDPSLLELLGRAPQPLPEELLDRVRALAGPASSPMVDPPNLKREPSEATGAGGAAGGETHVTYRVGERMVDRLQEEISDVLLSVGSLEMLHGQLGLGDAGAVIGQQIGRELEWIRRRVQSFQETARSLRNDEVSSVLGPIRVAAEAAARDLGKQIDFHVVGGQLKVDRRLLQELIPCLLHLVRNAVDHGFEATEARIAAGKPPVGQLNLSFFVIGGVLQVEVADDGAGIDLDRVTQQALEVGLVQPEELSAYGEEARYSWIFEEGFSTRDEVTDLSGRGVGLSSVAVKIQGLGGTVQARPNEIGTRIQLELPLATSSLSALVVEVGGQTMVIPLAAIGRVFAPTEGNWVSVAGQDCLDLGDATVGVRDLAALLGLPRRQAKAESPHLVLRGIQGRVALRVDRVVGQRQLVFRPLGVRFRGFPVFSGVTILGDGTAALALNPTVLLGRREVSSPGPAAEGNRSNEKAVLVVDDSVTMRTMTASLLETAGLRVIQAADGLEALERLAEANVSLVLTDVDMPRMDGLTLTRSLRERPETASLPVVLLTSNAGEEARGRGMMAGADAYLVKGDVDRVSLQRTIERFL